MMFNAKAIRMVWGLETDLKKAIPVYALRFEIVKEQA